MNDIDKALENLEAIKKDKSVESYETAAQTAPKSHPKTRDRLESDDALEVAKGEVDRLYDEYAELRDNLPRNNLWVGVSRNDGLNGICKYNKRLTKRRFNKQITQTEYKSGHHIIVINEKILEQGNRDDFLDTVRHEVAHALAYAIHGNGQKHNHHWKALAAKLGADPSSTHHKRDRSNEYEYYIGCPNCGMTDGKTRRSKVIKQPFNRKCSQCGESELVSYDAGDEIPEENGTVAVESLGWSNREEWNEAGRP